MGVIEHDRSTKFKRNTRRSRVFLWQFRVLYKKCLYHSIWTRATVLYSLYHDVKGKPLKAFILINGSSSYQYYYQSHVSIWKETIPSHVVFTLLAEYWSMLISLNNFRQNISGNSWKKRKRKTWKSWKIWSIKTLCLFFHWKIMTVGSLHWLVTWLWNLYSMILNIRDQQHRWLYILANKRNVLTFSDSARFWRLLCHLCL
jgi:hypothetical protein